ncbi:MAG: OB-fold domain-containing protein [Proteobacteria bacterium]|nr:OB-fold domain-containing protein [Pseudomonadota bacterium]
MSARQRVAAIEGWYTLDEPAHLLGSRCNSCGSYYFPRLSAGFCRNPACEGTSFETVPLSRTGRIWSYTNACYQPPPPFVSPTPFVPFAIAAVELAAERMIVLGQVVAGIDVGQLKVGMPMELVLESLYSEGDTDKLVWKWKPSGVRP